MAILESNKLKFKSFFNARKIFQLNQFYEVASDQQIDVFCSHENFLVANVTAFKEGADEGIRKLINAVSKAGIMDQYAVPVIVANAATLGLALTINGDKIVMPATRKEIKQLLRFLDDGIYEASLSTKRYVTNSKRPF